MKLYHATSRKNKGNISEQGLKRGGYGVVFLAESLELAKGFMVLYGEFDMIVYETDLPKDKVEESFDHNETLIKNIFKLNSAKCYMARMDIPSSQLKVVFETKEN